MKLVAATGNPHKLGEFRRILAPLGIEVIAPEDVGAVLDVEEDGETFAANAEIKAKALFEATGLPSFGDDSGLCVDALDGRPGVRTARYGGAGTPHAEKIRMLLEEMKDIPNGQRAAQFVSAICCVLDEGHVLHSEGVCHGEVGHEPLGENGFGYDPIFMVGERSFSQLSDDEKDEISHRGKALRHFSAALSDYIKSKEPTIHDNK